MAAFGMGGGGMPPMGAGFVSLDPMALAQQVAMILSQIAQGDAAMFQAQQDQAMQQASPLVMAMLGQGAPMADPMMEPPVDPSMAQVEGPIPEDSLGML